MIECYTALEEHSLNYWNKDKYRQTHLKPWNQLQVKQKSNWDGSEGIKFKLHWKKRTNSWKKNHETELCQWERMKNLKRLCDSIFKYRKGDILNSQFAFT